MNDLNLEKFPLRLQKLALYISKSPEILSIPEYCREAGMSYASIKQGISKSREKGNDFYEILNRLAYRKFTSQKPKMYKEVMDKALKGSFRHLQLYFQLSGDLKESKVESNTTQNLCFVMPMSSSIPMDQIVDAVESHEHPGNGVGPGSALGPGVDLD